MFQNRYFIILLFLISPILIFGQEGPVIKKDNATAEKDTVAPASLRIVSADKQIYDATGEDERFISSGNVRLTHDSVFMFCDTAVLVNGKHLEAKGNVVIIKNDTIRIFSDSLSYQGDSLMAYFIGNVVLEDGKQQLFTSYLQYDVEKDWAIYTDTALLRADNMEIKSKRGIFHLDENYVNFYEKVTIHGEDFDLLSDSLRYYTDTKRSIFLSPTLIFQGEKEIYAQGGYYDMDDKTSLFHGNAQYKEGDKVSTADTIRNDEVAEITILKGNARYQSADDLGTADIITVRSSTDDIELEGDAYFRNPENEVMGDFIRFNQKTDAVKVSGRSRLSNPPMIIVADDLDYQNTTGLAEAHGNVIWKDTSANYEIVSDHAYYNDATDRMKAFNDTGKPLLKNEMSGGDTLFLSGDTLISYTETHLSDSITIDTHRYFQAFAHVEMITADMQAVADSILYDGRDSTFVLHADPIMWSDSSQYSADTIVIKMQNDKVKRLDLIDDAMIISTSDFEFFDQIKGKLINAYFVGDDIDRMSITGGAQSVYYMKDEENAYMGVNETTCSNMMFIFGAGELVQIRHYKEPTSRMTPMDKADHKALRLSGFDWRILLRPKEVADLLK